MLHFEIERFTLTKKFDMETKLDNTAEQQHDAKLPVGSSASLLGGNKKVKMTKRDFIAIAFRKWVNSPEYKEMIEEMKMLGVIR